MKIVILALSTAALMITLTSCPAPKKSDSSGSDISKIEEKVQETGAAVSDAAKATTESIENTVSKDVKAVKDVFSAAPKFADKKAQEFTGQYTQYIKDVKEAALNKNTEKLTQLKSKSAEWAKKAKDIAATLKPEEAKIFNEHINKLNGQLPK